MITAVQARQNVIKYETETNAAVDKKVAELITVISESIEYQSRHGHTSAVFYPYENTRFPSLYAMERAQKQFFDILESAGFSVIRNNYSNNILEIEW